MSNRRRGSGVPKRSPRLQRRVSDRIRTPRKASKKMSASDRPERSQSEKFPKNERSKNRGDFTSDDIGVRNARNARNDDGDYSEDSLYSFLESEGLEAMHDGILGLGIRSITDLQCCNESDLRELSQALGLDIGKRLRFLGAVKKLISGQSLPKKVTPSPVMRSVSEQFVPNRARTPSFLVLRPEESAGIDKLNRLVEKADKAFENSQDLVQELQTNHDTCQGDINANFEQYEKTLIECLRRRRRDLLIQSDRIFQTKSVKLKQQRDELESVYEVFTEARRKCEEALQMSSLEDLSSRPQLVMDALANLPDYSHIKTEPVCSSQLIFGGSDITPISKAVNSIGSVKGLIPIPTITSISRSLNFCKIVWSVTGTEIPLVNKCHIQLKKIESLENTNEKKELPWNEPIMCPIDPNTPRLKIRDLSPEHSYKLRIRLGFESSVGSWSSVHTVDPQTECEWSKPCCEEIIAENLTLRVIKTKSHGHFMTFGPIMKEGVHNWQIRINCRGKIDNLCSVIGVCIDIGNKHAGCDASAGWGGFTNSSVTHGCGLLISSFKNLSSDGFKRPEDASLLGPLKVGDQIRVRFDLENDRIEFCRNSIGFYCAFANEFRCNREIGYRFACSAASEDFSITVLDYWCDK